MAKRAAPLKGRASSDKFRLPRAHLTVPFQLSIGGDGGTRFSAKLRSRDLSISGAFLSSSYYLAVGTRLQVAFQLEEGAAPLHATAEVVRHERADEEGGFALQFSEFQGEAKVALTELVLGEPLRAFTQSYLESPRARAFADEADRMVDLLASWELHKATARVGR